MLCSRLGNTTKLTEATLRRFNLTFYTFYTDGRLKDHALPLEIGVADVKAGCTLMDGRNVGAVEGDLVLLDDNEVLDVRDVLEVTIPSLAGSVIETGGEKLTIFAGPDTTGHIMFMDGTEAYLHCPDLFPGQGRGRARREILKRDRNLREQAGRVREHSTAA